MELTPAEERKILEGLKTLVDFVARSIAEHSPKEPLSKPVVTKAKTKIESAERPQEQPPRRPSVPHLIPVIKWNEHHEYPSVSSCSVPRN